MAKFVRKKVDEKELKLIQDCKRGITDKKGRPVAAIPQIAYRDGYAYIRVQRWDDGKLNKKTVTWKFATALGFNMDQAYNSEAVLEENGKVRVNYYETDW